MEEVPRRRVPTRPEDVLYMVGEAEKTTRNMYRIVNNMLGTLSTIRSGLMMYRMTLENLLRLGAVRREEIRVRVPRDIAKKLDDIYGRVLEIASMLRDIAEELGDVEERTRLLTEAVKYRYLV